MIGGRSALLGASGGDYGNWTGNYSNVSLLLRNGVPSLNPIDESPTPKTITQSGEARVTEFPGQWKYSGSALSLEASSYFQFGGTNDPAFDFGSGDFTIEAWVYPTNVSGNNVVVGNLTGDSASEGWRFLITDGELRFVVNNNTTTAIFDASGGAVPLNTYSHIAVTRQGTVLRGFINGLRVWQQSRTGNLVPTNAQAKPLRVGLQAATAVNDYLGFIDDLRITKGVARYVEGTGVNAGKMVFAGTNDLAHPLAELPANVTDDPSYNSVSLLLRNGVPGGPLVPADESPTPKEITKGGDVSISITTFKYGDSALAFNGSASYFSSPLNAGFDFGSGDFTVECWVNLNTLTVEQTFVSYTAGTTATAISFALDRLDTGVFRVYVCAGSIAYFATVSPAISTGTWYHVAGVRSGGQLRCYVNGVGGTAVSANVNVNTAAGRILRVGSLHTSTRFTNGFIDDLRITKGIARYTKNFLPPPAQLPAI